MWFWSLLSHSERMYTGLCTVSLWLEKEVFPALWLLLCLLNILGRILTCLSSYLATVLFFSFLRCASETSVRWPPAVLPSLPLVLPHDFSSTSHLFWLCGLWGLGTFLIICFHLLFPFLTFLLLLSYCFSVLFSRYWLFTMLGTQLLYSHSSTCLGDAVVSAPPPQAQYGQNQRFFPAQLLPSSATVLSAISACSGMILVLINPSSVTGYYS